MVDQLVEDGLWVKSKGNKFDRFGLGTVEEALHYQHLSLTYVFQVEIEAKREVVLSTLLSLLVMDLHYTPNLCSKRTSTTCSHFIPGINLLGTLMELGY